MSKYTRKEYIDFFQKYIEDEGNLELDLIDGKPTTSLNEDDGAFVRCWKWIDDAGIDAQKEDG